MKMLLYSLIYYYFFDEIIMLSYRNVRNVLHIQIVECECEKGYDLLISKLLVHFEHVPIWVPLRKQHGPTWAHLKVESRRHKL